MAARNSRSLIKSESPGSITVKPKTMTSKPSKYSLAVVEEIKPQQQNVKSGRAYIFGKRQVKMAVNQDQDVSDSEEQVQLKPRKPPKGRGERKKQSIQYIEETVEKGDTCQSLAIRYGCTVSEIRHLNNLYNDFDIYALKTVKIPLKCHSLLTEKEELEKRRKLGKERAALEAEVASSTTPSDSELTRVSDQMVLMESDDGCKADEDTEGEDREEGDYSLLEEEQHPLLASGYFDSKKAPTIKPAFKWKNSMNVVLQKLDEDLQKIREKNDEQRASKANGSHPPVEIYISPGYQTPKQSFEEDLLSTSMFSSIPTKYTIIGIMIGLILLVIFIIVVTGVATNISGKN